MNGRVRNGVARPKPEPAPEVSSPRVTVEMKLWMGVAGALVVAMMPWILVTTTGYNDPIFTLLLQILGVPFSLGLPFFAFTERKDAVRTVYGVVRTFNAALAVFFASIWGGLTDIPWRWPLFALAVSIAAYLLRNASNALDCYERIRTKDLRNLRKQEMRARIRKYPHWHSVLLVALFAGALFCGHQAAFSRVQPWVRGLEAVGFFYLLWWFTKIVNQVRLSRRYPWDADLNASGMSYLEDTKRQLQLTQEALDQLTKRMHGSIRQLNELMTSTKKLEQEAHQWRDMATIAESQATALTARLRKEGNKSVIWNFVFFLGGSLLTLLIAFWPQFRDFITAIFSALGLSSS